MRIEKKENCDQYDPRFVIVDDNNIVIDDAQGYGYKTKQKAAKAMWYKFKNGKQKIENKKKKIEKIFKENPGLEKFIDDLYEINVKEIAMGEYSSKDIIKAINDKFNIDFSEIYLI